MLAVLFGYFKQIFDCCYSSLASAKLQLLPDTAQSKFALLMELIKN